MLFQQVKNLVIKEFSQELKQKYALNGILLYVASTVFISYLSFKSVIQPSTWNALFWIILLFSSINAIAKSFMLESKGRQLYMYTLVSPQAMILSKVIYNGILMSVISLICFFFYGLFIGNIVQDIPLFLFVLLLGDRKSTRLNSSH